MSGRTSKTTRQTITTTYEFSPAGATLDDLRQFVEETVNLPAGSPIQTTLLSHALAVHETRVPTPEDLGGMSIAKHAKKAARRDAQDADDALWKERP